MIRVIKLSARWCVLYHPKSWRWGFDFGRGAVTGDLYLGLDFGPLSLNRG